MIKHIWILAAVFLCLGLYGQPAAAAYVTGKDLKNECRSDKADDMMGCMSYVEAVIDDQVMMQSMGTEPSVDFCLPDSLSIEKAAVTVMVYLERQPQLDDFIAAPSVAMALHDSYPCGPARSAHKKHRHG
jgi:hypothetical protein